MKYRTIEFVLLLLTAISCETAAWAAKPFRFPEGKHGRGELRYVNGLPVLLVQGTPAEIGDQLGTLALKPLLSGNQNLAGHYFGGTISGWLSATVFKNSKLLLSQFPPDHVKELDALAKSADVPRDLLIMANTYLELRKGDHCSALIVEGERSMTGSPFFAKNLDERTAVPLHEFTLVTVYRLAGKRSFASIGFPGMLGCCTAMNDAGLVLGDLSVNSAEDGSSSLDTSGTPCGLALRRVMEECSTVDEAERLLRSLRRTTMVNIAICDKRRGAVFEATTKQLIVRRATDALCACTNHFRSQGLARQASCTRYDLLETSRQIKRLALADVLQRIDAVANEGTLQTIIFEPAIFKLHLACGPAYASQYPLHELDLTKLLTTGIYPADLGLPRRDPLAGLPRIKKLDNGKSEVIFRYRPLGIANAVYLSGSFNNYKPEMGKMSGPDKDGYFETSVQLTRGRHEYKFVIESSIKRFDAWRNDPNNDEVAGFYRNSVIDVGP